NPPVTLSASPAAVPHLGDNANTPLGLLAADAAGYSATEGGSLAVTVTRSGASLDQALNVNFQTAAGTAGPSDFTPLSGTLTWAPNDPAQKTILIPLANDGIAEGTETLSLTLSS